MILTPTSYHKAVTEQDHPIFLGLGAAVTEAIDLRQLVIEVDDELIQKGVDPDFSQVVEKCSKKRKGSRVFDRKQKLLDIGNEFRIEFTKKSEIE